MRVRLVMLLLSESFGRPAKGETGGRTFVKEKRRAARAERVEAEGKEECRGERERERTKTEKKKIQQQNTN